MSYPESETAHQVGDLADARASIALRPGVPMASASCLRTVAWVSFLPLHLCKTDTNGVRVLLLRAYALCHTGYSVGHRGHLYGGHLHDLLARFRQSGADLRETIEAQSGQGLCLILCATPTPDHNREGRKPGPQPFTKIARLGKAPRRH